MDSQKIIKFKNTPLYGGSFLVGDTIEIDANVITMKRTRLFSRAYFVVTFPLINVVNVNIQRTKRGASILIESHTQNHIESKGFKYSSACKMKNIILQELHNSSSGN